MHKKSFFEKYFGNKYALIIAPVAAGIVIWILSGAIVLAAIATIAGILINWKQIRK